MLLERTNPVHWEWLVYLEMFVAGIAAGMVMVAALLELGGRGRSPLARTAHAVALPLVALCGLLLAVDLSRPDRFWHMVIQSETLRPMFKYWSAMSLGSQLLLLFGGVTFVSFVDFLISRGLFRLGGWRDTRTLHGSALGRVWAVLALLLGFAIASYSGVLLETTNMPGWGHSSLIGAVYVTTAIITGAATLVLIQALRGRADAEVMALAQTNGWLIVWWLLLIVLFLATLGEGVRFILAGTATVALIGAVLLGGVIPLALRFLTRMRTASALTLSATLVLVGGFLLRYAIVMGPQSVH